MQDSTTHADGTRDGMRAAIEGLPSSACRALLLQLAEQPRGRAALLSEPAQPIPPSSPPSPSPPDRPAEGARQPRLRTTALGELHRQLEEDIRMLRNSVDRPSSTADGAQTTQELLELRSGLVQLKSVHGLKIRVLQQVMNASKNPWP
eukprot:SAG31_NODE_2855_length_4992_cov_2.577560_2_plen_148_part_00